MWEAIATNWLLFREAILTAVIAGGVLGLLGVYVVSRRIIFVSAALGQVSALGIVLGFFFTVTFGLSESTGDSLAVGLALVLALVLVYSLGWLGGRGSMGRDAILGIAFIVPNALVLVLGPSIPQEMHIVEQILHGSAVLVRPEDLWAVAVVGALILLSQVVAFRGFVFASLDPVVARTQGVPVKFIDMLLFGAIALMTGLTTRALGAMPTFALTVLPAIAVMGLRIGLRHVFILAAIIGAASGAGGFIVAYLMDWSVGASQTVVAAGFLLAIRGLSLFRRPQAARGVQRPQTAQG